MVDFLQILSTWYFHPNFLDSKAKINVKHSTKGSFSTISIWKMNLFRIELKKQRIRALNCIYFSNKNEMINNGAIEKVVTTLLLLYFNWTICILKLLGYILPLDGSNFVQILQNFALLFLLKNQVHTSWLHVLGYNNKI